jgi:hypothetical protein
LSITKPAQEHKTRKQLTYYKETKMEYEINKTKTTNIVTLTLILLKWRTG